MIIATVPGGAQFYSNDAQLFSDGEVTIYSPKFLPEDTVLTSTMLRVQMTVATAGVSVQVADADSGYVLWSKDNLALPEGFEHIAAAIEEYGPEQ